MFVNILTVESKVRVFLKSTYYHEFFKAAAYPGLCKEHTQVGAMMPLFLFISIFYIQYIHAFHHIQGKVHSSVAIGRISSPTYSRLSHLKHNNPMIRANASQNTRFSKQSKLCTHGKFFIVYEGTIACTKIKVAGLTTAMPSSIKEKKKTWYTVSE
jgi:hypothetical protein